MIRIETSQLLIEGVFIYRFIFKKLSKKWNDLSETLIG